MRLRYSDEDEAFRAELIDWLATNAPTEAEVAETKHSSADMPDWARRWQRRLFDNGWLVPGWPPELGGRNASPRQQMIYFEELAGRDLQRSANVQGLGIVAPSILDYGNDEQKERFALPTLRAEIAWCIGMSEPGAGSDLAGISTRAEVHDDVFVVNGQKVWTSGAHHADWCLCYVRTGPTQPKHRGISALIIDMKSPGITCRPLAELTEPDFADFNEVFFSDVVVPRQNLLGELNGGWPITQGSLAHERAMLWVNHAQNVQRIVQGLIAAHPDARFHDAVASLYIDAQAMSLMGYLGFAKYAKGQSSPEHSLLKLFGSETQRRAFLTGVDAFAIDAFDRSREAPKVVRGGAWADQYLRAFAATIAGGTSEIQRNIIAERVLGLPR
ncbi:MAG: acyl-CoA dehydrogenase family protein [Actinobacteria bacterium]|nr:acyl-CoA dehydrogenase family protein [Actinomycetota bacterium]